jgi:hypothetical protein
MISLCSLKGLCAAATVGAELKQKPIAPGAWAHIGSCYHNGSQVLLEFWQGKRIVSVEAGGRSDAWCTQRFSQAWAAFGVGFLRLAMPSQPLASTFAVAKNGRDASLR